MADTAARSADGAENDETKRLSPENRRLRDWIREYNAEPLSDEDRDYWRKFREFVEAHPFTFRGEEAS